MDAWGWMRVHALPTPQASRDVPASSAGLASPREDVAGLGERGPGAGRGASGGRSNPCLSPPLSSSPRAASGLPSAWGCGALERDCRAPAAPSGCHIGHVGGAGDCRAKAKSPVLLPKWLVGWLVFFSFKNSSLLQGGLGGLGRRCRVLQTSMEEPLLQPALVLSKCRATKLFPPGSSTALSRV